MSITKFTLAFALAVFTTALATAQATTYETPTVSETVVNQTTLPRHQAFPLFAALEFRNVSPSVNWVTATIQITNTAVPTGRRLGFPDVTVRNAAGFPANVTVTTANDNATINLLGTPPNARVNILQQIYAQ